MLLVCLWCCSCSEVGPKPSLFFVFSLLFWGFKGQVRWPKGPPHLALNPPYLFVFFCFSPFFFAFFSLRFIDKTCFAPQEGIFVYFQCLLSFLFSLFLASPFFTFSFFVSLSLLFFSFFLPSCFSCLFLALVFNFCFVCFLFQDVVLFLFISACCFVLFES